MYFFTIVLWKFFWHRQTEVEQEDPYCGIHYAYLRAPNVVGNLKRHT